MTPPPIQRYEHIMLPYARANIFILDRSLFFLQRDHVAFCLYTLPAYPGSNLISFCNIRSHWRLHSERIDLISLSSNLLFVRNHSCNSFYKIGLLLSYLLIFLYNKKKNPGIQPFFWKSFSPYSQETLYNASKSTYWTKSKSKTKSKYNLKITYIGLKINYHSKNKPGIGLKILLNISTYIGLKINLAPVPPKITNKEHSPSKNNLNREKGELPIFHILTTHMYV